MVEDDLRSFAAFPVVLSFGFPLRTSFCLLDDNIGNVYFDEATSILV